MFLVFLNVVFILVFNASDAARIDGDVIKYFQHSDRRLLQKTWQKYKRGFENSLEKILQENYDGKGMNIFKRRLTDTYKLTEGFMEVSDPILDVVFRDLYLLELPRMRSPKVLFTLGSHLLKVDAELLNVKVMAKYMVYRNDSVVVFATGSDQLDVSPFSLQQAHITGDVTIIGEECRLAGHTIVALSDQSVNLGHNTFSLTDCKFKLEIWTPGQGSPPIFARYFDNCDRNFLMNLISKPLQEELMSKLQGGIFSFVNTSEIFGESLRQFREREINQFRKVNEHMREMVNNLNVLTINKNQGVMSIDRKPIGWTETIDKGTFSKTVVISNVSLYGLDTAYLGHTGGPIELNGKTFIEETIGFNTLQVQGKILYQSFASPSVPSTPKEVTSKFSAEIHGFTVVIRIAVVDGALKASNLDTVDKEKRSWYTPMIRNFELNLFEISEIWARSLVTGYLTNEIYTSVVMTLLSGQLNKALKQTADGESGKINTPEGVKKKLNKVEDVVTKDIDNSPPKKAGDGDGHPDLDEVKPDSDEESMVLWQNKKKEDVVLTIGKQKVRVDSGNRTLFEANRASDNEINT